MIVGIVGLEGGDRQPFFAAPWLPVFRGTDTAYRPGPRLQHMSGLYGCSNMYVSCDIQGVSSVGDGKDPGRSNRSALHWVEKHRSSASFQRRGAPHQSRGISIEGLDLCTETVSDAVVAVSCGRSGLLRRMSARNGQQAVPPLLSILDFEGGISAGGSVSGILRRPFFL